MAELTFKGFSPAAFAFYGELADNNEKAWFEAHRGTFETEVRQPLEALMLAAAERFGGTVKLSRPHRDVRFSKDKSPYKLNLFAVVHSRPETDAALYGSVSAKGLTVGTGYYEMSTDQLARFRAALDDPDKAARLREALDALAESAIVRGRSLKSAPRGVARDHPAIDLMRMKEIVALREFSPSIARTATVAKKAFAMWDAAAPLNGWLDRHVGPPETDGRRR